MERMERDHLIQNTDELEFVIFCVESVAAKLGAAPEKVYHALTDRSSILYQYIVPEYPVLHTQSKEYIVEDILDVMREKGVEV